MSQKKTFRRTGGQRTYIYINPSVDMRSNISWQLLLHMVNNHQDIYKLPLHNMGMYKYIGHPVSTHV